MEQSSSSNKDSVCLNRDALRESFLLAVNALMWLQDAQSTTQHLDNVSRAMTEDLHLRDFAVLKGK